MVLGAGDIGTKTLFALAHSDQRRTLFLGGKDGDTTQKFVNLTRFSALQQGHAPELHDGVVDVFNVERTAETIESFKPDVIFSAVSMQSWWVMFGLPEAKFTKLYEACFGPWVALHLAPTSALMQAVRAAGSTATVVNAAFPDAVHPALAPSDLSPHVGIGNVANNVPGLRTVIADLLKVETYQVSIRFAAHHYVSHRLTRTGDSGGAPFWLQVLVDGCVTEAVTPAEAFNLLKTRYRRTSGMPGQAMTVASALSVLEPMLRGSEALVHAPGPLGLVGGYPVKISDRSVQVALEGGDKILAEDINIAGQKFDGIERIGEDGTIYFTDWACNIMREQLGYDCPSLKWDESKDRAQELRAKYRRFAEAPS